MLFFWVNFVAHEIVKNVTKIILLSKKSFDLYWKKISLIKDRFDVNEISKTNINESENIIPKFIEEFEKKVKK